ncbi:hypothetical protein B0A52_06748 [Exophiala mesophila]|uniref:Major facilitator superfamily (MFS) profile domain-containing protein n=1 Tax=Exophiala mesophila TaxID=212818 RepID=A0A438N012_EXOME|nr:hypothetical protein B0A52_06748 [Exophiala mesophila]
MLKKWGRTVMWIIGINQLSTLLLSLPKEVGGYGFSRDALSYMYFAPIIGILVGAGLGRFVIDFACNRYIQHHNGVYAPEARIPPTYFATLFLVPGLVLFGQALAFRLSWVALAAGWILYVIGGFMSAVATTSYLVDFYTAAAAQISTILSFARLITGFSISYFQVVISRAGQESERNGTWLKSGQIGRFQGDAIYRESTAPWLGLGLLDEPPRCRADSVRRDDQVCFETFISGGDNAGFGLGRPVNVFLYVLAESDVDTQ